MRGGPVWADRAAKEAFHANQEPEALRGTDFRRPVACTLPPEPVCQEVGSGEGQASVGHGITYAHFFEAELIKDETNAGGATGEETTFSSGRNLVGTQARRTFHHDLENYVNGYIDFRWCDQMAAQMVRRTRQVALFRWSDGAIRWWCSSNGGAAFRWYIQ